MNVGGRRQLPSWMMRATATDKASCSETKGENKENGSLEPPVKPRKKVREKKHDTGSPLIEKKFHSLKTCEAKKRKRKLNKHDEDQGENFQEDDPCSLKPCKVSRRKRMSRKCGVVRVEEVFESDVENKVDGFVKKRVQENAPMKKHSKKLMEEVHNGPAESGPSEEELTVEDLVRIAEEYLKTSREDFENFKTFELEPESNSLLRDNSEIVLEKDLISCTESKFVNDEPLSTNSSSTKPLFGEGSIINQCTIFDPVRDMLDLILGPWSKKSEDMERKTHDMTETTMLDYELSRSQNDTIAEVAPVTKKKYSLKDKVGGLLD